MKDIRSLLLSVVLGTLAGIGSLWGTALRPASATVKCTDIAGCGGLASCSGDASVSGCVLTCQPDGSQVTCPTS